MLFLKYHSVLLFLLIVFLVEHLWHFFPPSILADCRGCAWALGNKWSSCGSQDSRVCFPLFSHSWTFVSLSPFIYIVFRIKTTEAYWYLYIWCMQYLLLLALTLDMMISHILLLLYRVILWVLLRLHHQAATTTYVARTKQHWNGHDTGTHDKFLKIHTTRVSDTFRTRHGFMIGMSVLHRLQQPQQIPYPIFFFLGSATWTLFFHSALSRTISSSYILFNSLHHLDLSLIVIAPSTMILSLFLISVPYLAAIAHAQTIFNWFRPFYPQKGQALTFSGCTLFFPIS